MSVGRFAGVVTAFGLSILSSSGRAQTQVRVAPRVGVELVPIRRLSIEIAERYVHGARIANSGRAQTYLGLAYALTHWLDVGVGYRLSFESYRSACWSGHRTTVDVAVAGGVHGIQVAGRVRWLSQWTPDRSGYEWNTRFRTRIKLRFRPVKPLDLFASGELFSSIVPASLGAEAFRFEAGLVGRLDPVDITFAWRYQAPIQGSSQSYHMMMATVLWHWERQRADPAHATRQRERRNRRSQRAREHEGSEH